MVNHMKTSLRGKSPGILNSRTVLKSITLEVSCTSQKKKTKLITLEEVSLI